MDRALDLNRREFAKVIGGAAAVAGGLVLGVPSFGEEREKPPEVETNIADSPGGWSR
jgi:hypothetical protein